MADVDAAGRGKKNALHLPVSLTLEHVSPVTRLLEKRKQMLLVQENLDVQKEEYNRKEELFKRREENLRKKDLELQEALVLFNKFLKENEQKRRRADLRATEEMKKKMKWEHQILERAKDLNILKEKCKKLRRNVEKNDQYQSYLQNVYEENSNLFDDISQIISRYLTLKQTHDYLLRVQSELNERNESLRNEYNTFKKEQYNFTLSKNNEIASYSRELEECVKKTSELNETIINEEKQEIQTQRLTTQIMLASENLYSRCRRHLSELRKRHGGGGANSGGGGGGGGEKDEKDLDRTKDFNATTSSFKSGSNTSGNNASSSSSANNASSATAAASNAHSNSTGMGTSSRLGDAELAHLLVTNEARLSEINQYLLDFKDIVESISGVPFEHAGNARRSKANFIRFSSVDNSNNNNSNSSNNTNNHHTSSSSSSSSANTAATATATAATSSGAATAASSNTKATDDSLAHATAALSLKSTSNSHKKK